MKRELELKHLTGYLPYKLKALGYYPDGKEFITEVNLINVSNYVDKTTRNKILLRPLSDLTKEIEDENIKGIKVVPIERIWNATRGEVDLEWISQHHVLSTPYYVIQMLYEWHFDVHGLIDDGLALDLNNHKR